MIFLYELLRIASRAEGALIADSFGQTIVRFFDSIPAFVPIHGVIASAHGGNFDVGVGFQLSIKSSMNCSALFGGVSRPSRTSADKHGRAFHCCAPSRSQRFHMALMAVHAAVAEKTHEMQAAAICSSFCVSASRRTGFL